ncbi:MAG: hypothetical protein WEC73_01960 [Chthoniobacterales bacterium]
MNFEEIVLEAPMFVSPPGVSAAAGDEDKQAELCRVLDSPDFPATPRNRAFLAYIVQRELAGEGGSVTAHGVATSVFGRPELFSSLLDPIVRIEAGKLRRDLETYYLKSGRHNPLRITVPRGAYRPHFAAPDHAEPPAGPGHHGGALEADPRAELRRVLESPDFPATPRNRRFLACVVERSLEGREGEITAYRLGTEVFGRAEGFSPSNDPIVRIEAGKLRRDLETYYLKSGSRNPLRIGLPKGAYRPVFVPVG